MLGQKIDYNIEVDGGKSRSGTVISFYTGLFISITEYGSLVFHNGANQKVIYTPTVLEVYKINTGVEKDIEVKPPINIEEIILEKTEEEKIEEEKISSMVSSIFDTAEKVEEPKVEEEPKIEKPKEVKQAPKNTKKKGK